MGKFCSQWPTDSTVRGTQEPALILAVYLSGLTLLGQPPVVMSSSFLGQLPMLVVLHTSRTKHRKRWDWKSLGQRHFQRHWFSFRSAGRMMLNAAIRVLLAIPFRRIFGV